MTEEPRLFLAFLLGFGAGTLFVGWLCLMAQPDKESREKRR